MKQYSAFARQLSAKGRATVGERIAAFLRETHPTKTAEHVAADLGIAPATVAKWLERGSAPNGWAFPLLIGAYGPEFLCAFMGESAPAWLVRARREEEQVELRKQLAELQARLERTA